jgi:hypothetical protein
MRNISNISTSLAGPKEKSILGWVETGSAERLLEENLMVGIFYKCLKCGKRREIRRSKKPGNLREKYLALEREMKVSKIAHLHRGSGQRSLCPTHLLELVQWQRPVDSK